MFNLQGSEIIVILLLALVVLGPEKLPEAVRKFTKTYTELKKMSTGFQSELKSALDEPMREMRETANLVRDAADPSKIMAEAQAEQRVLDDADAATAGRLADPTPANDWADPAGNGGGVPTTWAAPVAGTADPSLNGHRPTARLDDPASNDPASDDIAAPAAPPDSAPERS